MSDIEFKKRLEEGFFGEDIISKWFKAYGWNILPAYEKEVGSGKGPRLFMASSEQLISPDLLIFQEREIRWVEAKTKSAFTWHRNSQSWQTGIDKRHWMDYLRVSETTLFPLYLFFLHKPDMLAKDTPEGMKSPSGLYGGDIQELKEKIDHESDRHGPSGMEYWKEESLKKYSEYDDVIKMINENNV